MRDFCGKFLQVFNVGPEREVNEINSSFWQVVCYVAEVIPRGVGHFLLLAGRAAKKISKKGALWEN